jgi:hypothetical protein
MLGVWLIATGCAVAGADTAQTSSDVTSTCHVARPPAYLGLDAFYVKYCDAGGMPVVAASVVPDLAVQQASAIAAAMLAPNPSVRDELVALHVRYGIIGEHQLASDMPEFRGQAWATGRGYGATATLPLAVNGEENVMCYEATNGNWDENIVVHEMGHTIMTALQIVDPDLRARVVAAYAAAMQAGKYRGFYAATNVEEYWAEGVQDYVGGHAWHDANDITTRAELAQYDPALYATLDEVFADVRMPALCPTPVFDATATYRIASLAYPGKSLDVTDMNPSGNYSGQHWHLHALAGRAFRLTNDYTGASRALDTANDGVYELMMAPAGTFSGQYWHLGFYDNGVYRVTNAFRGKTNSLDAEPDGGPVEVDANTQYSNQLWTVTPI